MAACRIPGSARPNEESAVVLRKKYAERTRIGDSEGKKLLEHLVDELDCVVARLRNDRVGCKNLAARQSRCSSYIGIVVLNVPHDIIPHELAQAVLCRFGCSHFVSSARATVKIRSPPEDDVRSWKIPFQLNDPKISNASSIVASS